MKKIWLMAILAVFTISPIQIIFAHKIDAHTPQYTKHQKNTYHSRNQEYYGDKNICHHKLFEQDLWTDVIQYMNALRHDIRYQNLPYPLDYDTLRYFDEEENTYIVKIYLGFNALAKKEVNISAQNQNLWIQINAQKQRKSKNNAHYFSSSIQRYFSLPRDANTDKIVHSYNNNTGVLTIKIAQKPLG